ncbi:hypothetical protein O9929_18080 [Vibrio lentus]|nr:hypothetical protein [Vibrio lentus]
MLLCRDVTESSLNKILSRIQSDLTNTLKS